VEFEWHAGTTQPRQSCSYRSLKPEGSFTAWHPDGKPWVQGQFAAGQTAGKWKQWDVAGNEVAEGTTAADGWSRARRWRACLFARRWRDRSLLKLAALLAGRLGAGGLDQLQSQCKLVQRLGASFAPTA